MEYIHQENNRNSFSIILLSLPILPKVVLYHIHSAVCYTEGVCPSLYIYFSRLLNQFMTCAPLTTGVNWKAAVFKRTFLAFLCLSVHIMRCLLLGSMRGFLVTEYPPWRGVQVKHQWEDRPTGYILKLKLSSTQVLTGSEWIDLEPDVSPRPLWFRRNFVILETDWVYLLQVLDLVSFNKEINVQFRIEHFLNLDWTLIITKVKEIKTSKTVTIYVCVFVLVCLPVVRLVCSQEWPRPFLLTLMEPIPRRPS